MLHFSLIKLSGLSYDEPSVSVQPAAAAISALLTAAAAAPENLDDLIQLSEELTAKAVLGRATTAGEEQRPRHASSSSDISSEGERKSSSFSSQEGFCQGCGAGAALFEL